MTVSVLCGMHVAYIPLLRAALEMMICAGHARVHYGKQSPGTLPVTAYTLAIATFERDCSRSDDTVPW